MRLNMFSYAAATKHSCRRRPPALRLQRALRRSAGVSIAPLRKQSHRPGAHPLAGQHDNLGGRPARAGDDGARALGRGAQWVVQ